MTEAPCQSGSLADWLLWLEQLDPSRIDLGLERIRRVYRDLPQLTEKTKVVTVAGTNGKGSSVAALQAASLALGKSVVAFTSPHLLQYNERIHINGQPVADRDLIEAFRLVAETQKDTFLSYFEYSALAALLVAAQEQPDLLILEVGLGGRLDAVNIIDADIVLLTAIGMDHMNWLGTDLQSIAREKCGVLRPGIPLVLAAAEMPEVVYQLAEQASADIYQWGKDFVLSATGRSNYQLKVGAQSCKLSRFGLQEQSLAAAAKVVDLLWSVELYLIKTALQSAELAGRFQRIKFGKQDVILDVAHNPMSVENLCRRLLRENIGQVNLLIAMMADKEWQGCFKILRPFVKEWHLLRLDNSRAASPEDMTEFLTGQGILKANIIEPCHNSEWLQNILSRESTIPLLVSGSFYTVSTVLARYNNAN